MKAIEIGKNANGQPIHLTPEMRQNTHMHVIGGSGKGKSKFLDWLVRRDIREGHGLCLIDWHGTLYQDVLSFCAQLDIGLENDFRKLILLNPSEPDFISGFNPFMNQGGDISVQVRRRVDATIRPWGVTDTNAMPTFEYITTLLYTFAVEQQQTLANSALLLDFTQHELREHAIEVLSSRRSKQGWRRLQMMKSFRDWDAMVLSTENRISRFLGSNSIRRFMGLPSGNIDLREIMDQGNILLVNLGSSQFLDREAAKVFASLFLNEFLETSMVRASDFRRRSEKPPTFLLYLDEFQEYITEDMSGMLDQVRKGGLHMVLAHQHLGHLADNPRLRKSIFTNARLRAVLGGLDYEDGCVLANEMFLPDLNTRQIKKAYYHTSMVYEEQKRIIKSTSSGRGTSETDNWSKAVGSSSSTARGYSTSGGSGFSSGSSSMFGAGRSASTSFSAPGARTGATDTEGWFTEGESSNDFVSHGSTESSVDFWSEGESEIQSETTSESSSEGGARSTNTFESSGESVVPVWVPIPIQELGSESEWSREEKVSKVAEMRICQMKQHCFIKLDEVATQPLRIPTVRDYSYLQDYLLEYEKEVYEAQGAVAAAEVDLLVDENEQKFLAIAVNAKDRLGPKDAIDVTGEAAPPKTKPIRARKSARESIFSKIKETV